MSAITYATGLTRNMAQIHVDGDYVGLLFKEADYVGDGGPFYLIDLHDDPRGPGLVRNRSLLSEIVQDRVATHPGLTARPGIETGPRLDFVPF